MTNTIITIVMLFNAVCQVENPSGKKGVHSDGHSYGVAGVTAGCLADVNAYYRTNYRLSDMDSPALAYEVFVKYTDLRLMVKHLEPTPDNRLRVWHGATDEAETQRYIEAVMTGPDVGTGDIE
jgi:hypothetical protein